MQMQLIYLINNILDVLKMYPKEDSGVYLK